MARVNAALSSYLAALLDMKMEIQIRKEDELPIWVALAEAAGFAVVGFAIGRAVAATRIAGHAIQELASEGIEADRKEVEVRILGVKAETIEALIEKGVDKGKERLAEDVGKAVGEEKVQQKGAEISYIDRLASSAMMTFQLIREGRLDSASDEQLIAMFDAFHGSRHTMGIYEAMLKQHVAVYMGSHAKSIGHRIELGWGSEGISSSGARKEMRVAWVVNGRASQLVYMEKTFVPVRDPGLENEQPMTPGPAYDAPANALGMEEQGTWKDNLSHKDVQHKQEGVEPEFLGPVESELQEAALVAHEKRWLQPPQRLMKGPYGWIEVKR
ncbi:MAG: hypothetical protein ABI591_00230 [Kofleriaceae bacterium]